MLEKTEYGIRIRVPDEIRESPQALVKTVNDLISEIEKSKIGRILYEINEPTTKLNGGHLVHIANLLADQLTFEVKIAVFSEQYNEHLTAIFIENLISSKKIPTKYFSDYTLAVNWLKQ